MKLKKYLIFLSFCIIFNCKKEKNNIVSEEKFYSNELLDSAIVKYNDGTIRKFINENNSVYRFNEYKNNKLYAIGDLFKVNDSVFIPNNFYATFFNGNENEVWKLIKYSRDFNDKNRIILVKTNNSKGTMILDSTHTFLINQFNEKLDIELYSCCIEKKELVIKRNDGINDIYISDSINHWNIDLSLYPNYQYLYGYVEIHDHQKQLERQTGVNNFKSEFSWTILKDSLDN